MVVEKAGDVRLCFPAWLKRMTQKDSPSLFQIMSSNLLFQIRRQLASVTFNIFAIL